MPTIQPSVVATAYDAVTAPDTPGEQPATTHGTPDMPSGYRTMHWDGAPQGWWARNGVTAGLGTVGAVAGGFGGAVLARDLAFAGGPALAAAGGAVLVGGTVALVTHLVRRGGDELPAAPATPPLTLPEASSAPQVIGGELPRGAQLAHAHGSYWSWDPVTKTRYVNGQTETYTDNEYRYHTFGFRLDNDHGQVGARGGYGSIDEAARDLTETGSAIALRSQSGRLVAYDLRGGEHWGDIDDFEVLDPSIRGVISPGGTIWRRDTSGTGLHEDGSVDLPDPLGRLRGDSIGELEVRYHHDPDVQLDVVRSGAGGFSDLSDALGDIRARGGDQAVVSAAGRYYVTDVTSPELDPSVPLDGFTAKGSSANVVAVEQHGEVWSPSGDWYLTPDAADG